MPRLTPGEEAHDSCVPRLLVPIHAAYVARMVMPWRVRSTSGSDIAQKTDQQWQLMP